MLSFERDYGRRGFEVIFLRHQWFIEDNKIENSKLLKLFFYVVYRYILVRNKVWMILHKKELEKARAEAAKIEFIQVNEFVKIRKL